MVYGHSKARGGLKSIDSRSQSLGAATNTNINLEVFKQQLKEQEDRIEAQKKQIQQRLVAYNDTLSLKKSLKKKIKPLMQDPSIVPFNIFHMIV